MIVFVPRKGRADRRTCSSPPEHGASTAPVVPPTGAVPFSRAVRPLLAHGPGAVLLVPPVDRDLVSGCPQSLLWAAGVHRASSGRRRRGGARATVGAMSHRVVGVIGASGGVGSSTLAVALALRATPAVGAVTCVDLVLQAGGLDVTACVEHLPGLRWPDLAGARGRLDGADLMEALPAEGPVRVLAAGSRGDGHAEGD